MIDWIAKATEYLQLAQKHGEEKAKKRFRYSIREERAVLGDEAWKEFDGDLNKFRDHKFIVEEVPYGYHLAGYFVTPIDPETPPERGQIVWVPSPYSLEPERVISYGFVPADSRHQELLKSNGLFNSEEEAIIGWYAETSDRASRV